MGRPKTETAIAETSFIYGESPLNLESASDEELTSTGAYGENRTMKVYLKDLVMLRQVRDARNPVAEELQSSLWNTKKLINQIDVARLTREEFEQYVAFCNRLWKADQDPSQFPVAEDGYIYLVMAGHTRLEAMIGLEDAKALERGTRGLPEPEEEPYTIVKVEEGIDPLSILSIQVNENIHKGPPQERQMMAMVEAYMLGLELGRWSSKAEFLKQSGKFSRQKLNEALHFAELPPEIRSIALLNGIPYRAGVELGKTVPKLREYFIHMHLAGRNLYEFNEQDEAEIETALLEWLGAEVTRIQIARSEGRFSGAVIKSSFESIRSELDKLIAQLTGQDHEGALEGFEMILVNESLPEVRRRKRREYARLLRDLGSVPISRTAEIIQIHIDLVGRADPNDPELSTILHNLGHSYQSSINSKVENLMARPQDTSLF